MTNRAYQRAAYNYTLTQIIHDVGEIHSCRDLVAILREANQHQSYTMSNGDVLHVPVASLLRKGESLSDPRVLDRVTPSHASVWRLRKIDPADNCIAIHVAKPRSGRPLKKIGEATEAALRSLMLRHHPRSTRKLVRKLRKVAEAAGEPTLSTGRVRRWFQDVSPVVLVAARHGKRAGVADATTKGALPFTRPFEFWVFDEGVLPVWIRVYHAILKCYVAIKPPICLVVDAVTQVIMGYYIGNPLSRGVEMHMDAVEMQGALLSAIFPALATPECKPYVGYLPERIGCDNLPAHGDVMSMLNAATIVTTQHVGYSPWSHATRETTVGIIKGLCEDLRGYDGTWQVAENVDHDPVARRKALAATYKRESPLSNISIAQLMDITELREKIQPVITEYNSGIDHSRWQEPREARFYECLRPEKLRPWTDALSMLKAHRVTVREHLVVRGVEFATTSDIGHVFSQGDSVTVRVDPLLRAAFVVGESPSEVGAIQPAREAARKAVPGEVVRQQHTEAQNASNAARAEREAYQESVLGTEGAALANGLAAMKPGKEAKRAAAERKAAQRLSRDAKKTKAKADQERIANDPLLRPDPTEISEAEALRSEGRVATPTTDTPESGSADAAPMVMAPTEPTERSQAAPLPAAAPTQLALMATAPMAAAQSPAPVSGSPVSTAAPASPPLTLLLSTEPRRPLGTSTPAALRGLARRSTSRLFIPTPAAPADRPAKEQGS